MVTLLAVVTANAAGYNIGDKAIDFKLKNVDQKYVSFWMNSAGWIPSKAESSN
jgi:hypothetical protein